MSRGTDEQFDAIVLSLRKVVNNYGTGQTRYITYCDSLDALFNGNYGWSKKAFYEELNRRLGIQTNDSRREDKEKKLAAMKPAKKTRKRASKKMADPPPRAEQIQAERIYIEEPADDNEIPF